MVIYYLDHLALDVSKVSHSANRTVHLVNVSGYVLEDPFSLESIVNVDILSNVGLMM